MCRRTLGGAGLHHAALGHPTARLFLGEPIGPGRRAGLLLGLAGLILIFNPLAFDWSDRAAIFGNALVLLAALCWAANIVYVRAHRWVTPPFELAFWQALLATVVLSAAARGRRAARDLGRGPRVAARLRRGVRLAVAYWAAVNVNRSLPRRHIHRPAGRARVRPAVLGGGAGRALGGALLAGMGLIVGGSRWGCANAEVDGGKGRGVSFDIYL
ncbi:EamA family transporter [Achromobacter xylosoxidans]